MCEERREGSGWFGYGRGEESTADAAYGRVTNAGRFLPLHTAMLEIICQLENDFEVERTEGYGLDEELERGLDRAHPDVKLTSADPDAAPTVVAFTAFPGLCVRFGRWYVEPFPSCGCDACDGRRRDCREVSRGDRNSPHILYAVWMGGDDVLVA